MVSADAGIDKTANHAVVLEEPSLADRFGGVMTYVPRQDPPTSLGIFLVCHVIYLVGPRTSYDTVR
jgi:hypothetical protein